LTPFKSRRRSLQVDEKIASAHEKAAQTGGFALRSRSAVADASATPTASRIPEFASCVACQTASANLGQFNHVSVATDKSKIE
jgi:hypothetical protein